MQLKLPFVIRYVLDQQKTQQMWDKAFLENDGTLESVPDCYKNQQVCDKGAYNFEYKITNKKSAIFTKMLWIIPNFPWNKFLCQTVPKSLSYIYPLSPNTKFSNKRIASDLITSSIMQRQSTHLRAIITISLTLRKNIVKPWQPLQAEFWTNSTFLLLILLVISNCSFKLVLS